MTEILSHKFMLAIDESRDRLYALALAGAPSPAKAEAALQKAIRAQFAAFTSDPYADVAVILVEQLTPAGAPPAAPVPMPADVWARLSAAVQVEASQSNSATALNPESVLLSPDPLLAPRKSSVLDDGEAFDLSPPSRFALASLIAIVIGVLLTIYILTRPTPTSPHAAVISEAASQPGTMPSTRAVSP